MSPCGSVIAKHVACEVRRLSCAAFACTVGSNLQPQRGPRPSSLPRFLSRRVTLVSANSKVLVQRKGHLALAPRRFRGGRRWQRQWMSRTKTGCQDGTDTMTSDEKAITQSTSQKGGNECKTHCTSTCNVVAASNTFQTAANKETCATRGRRHQSYKT